MILELLLTPIITLMLFITSIIPDMSHIDPLSGQDISGFIQILAYGFIIFPFSLFAIFISNVVFWKTTQITWAIIEWVYKKIPGVN